MNRIEPTRTQWDAWTFGAPLQQCWSYGEAARALGARVERYAAGGTSEPGAVVQVIRRFGIGYAPVGLHRRRPEAAPGARPPGLTLIAEAGGWAVTDARQVAVRALGAELRAAMAKKWRNRLHFAERTELRIRRIGGCPRWLTDAEAAQRSARGYRALPAAWLRAMSDSVPASVVTYAAFVASRPVAGVCILRHPGRCTYHLGWTGPEGRSRSAHHLLITTAMEDAARTGAAAFDLGVVDPANDGLRRFKMGTGAELVTLPRMAISWNLSAGVRSQAPVRASPRAAGRAI